MVRAGRAAPPHLPPAARLSTAWPSFHCLPAPLRRWQHLRWCPTSHEEGVWAERRLLDRLRGSYSQSDMQVGSKREEYIHTVVGAPPLAAAGSPAEEVAFVAIPGYGSGSSFLFKLFDGLSSAFRLYAVDLLGTGLSGVRWGGLEGGRVMAGVGVRWPVRCALLVSGLPSD